MTNPHMTTAEPQSKLILASRVINTPVYSKDGDAIGHVDDISIERVSGRSIYGIMSFGGFLGIGEKFHPLPWHLLDYDPARGGFVVPMNKDELKTAPNYTRNELEALGGASHHESDAALLEYYGKYGAFPYW